jgi:integrase
VKGLRWRDVDFMERTITIRRSKTVAGERVIPLNVDAWVVVLSLSERTKNLFGDKLE